MASGSDTADQIPLGFGELLASPGDHIGQFYQNQAECLEILAAFLEAGHAGGEKCVCLCPADEAPIIQELLSARGIDVEEGLTSGQLLFDNGRSGPAEMKKLLRRAMADVPHRFPRLRWAGDMTWSVSKVATTEALMEWESHCNCVEEPDPVFLCQYDLRLFPGYVIMDALRTHPVCIVANKIHQNPFYQTAESYMEEVRGRPRTGLLPSA